MHTTAKGARALLSAAMAASFLSGCSGLYTDHIDPAAGDKPATVIGTPQVIPRAELAKVDLDDLILENSITVGKEACAEKKLKGTVAASKTDEERINTVLRLFYHCNKQSSGDIDSIENRRNRIQSHIMTAAKRRCEVYKQYVSNLESHSGFWLGSATTISGILGSLFTATSTARAFSAGAGITSGIEAELNQSFFKETAVPVIFTGIDMKRLEVQSDIDQKRKKSIADYNLEEAIGDAIRYNGACSTVEGLKHVKDTLARPVGIIQAREVMRQVDLARQELAIANMAPEDRTTRYTALAQSEQARLQYEQAASRPPAPAGSTAAAAGTGTATADDKAAGNKFDLAGEKAQLQAEIGKVSEDIKQLELKVQQREKEHDDADKAFKAETDAAKQPAAKETLDEAEKNARLARDELKTRINSKGVLAAKLQEVTNREASANTALTALQTKLQTANAEGVKRTYAFIGSAPPKNATLDSSCKQLASQITLQPYGKLMALSGTIDNIVKPPAAADKTCGKP